MVREGVAADVPDGDADVGQSAKPVQDPFSWTVTRGNVMVSFFLYKMSFI